MAIRFRSVYTDVHSRVVDNYLEILRLCVKHRGFKTGIASPQLPSGVYDSIINEVGGAVWQMLTDARVIECSDLDFINLYHLADVHTCEHIAGVKWTPALENQTPESKAEAKQWLEAMPKALPSFPFPERLPFPVIYIAWGGGVGMTHTQTYFLSHYDLKPGEIAQLIATLVTETGNVATIWEIRKPTAVPPSVKKHLEEAGHTEMYAVETDVRVQIERIGGRGWLNPWSLTPWLVSYVAEAVERADTLVAAPQKLSTKLALKRIVKDAGGKHAPPPPPFYPVVMTPQFYIEHQSTGGPRKHLEYSHSFDVRAHQVTRFVRGQLPLKAEDYHKLIARKYRIFDAMHPPDAETWAALARRHMRPVGPGEWIAILTYHRRSFRKGGDKPYIPSVHKLKEQIPVLIADKEPA